MNLLNHECFDLLVNCYAFDGCAIASSALSNSMLN